MPPFEAAWQKLLQEIALAKHYSRFYMMAGIIPGVLIKHPILEQLLPTLLFVNLVSLLDEVLAAKLDSDFPATKANTLDRRISAQQAAGVLAGPAADLHALRHKRNGFAHETGSAATWQELDTATATVANEFVNLGAIAPPPREPYTWFAERSGMETAAEPGALFQQTCQRSPETA